MSPRQASEHRVDGTSHNIEGNTNQWFVAIIKQWEGIRNNLTKVTGRLVYENVSLFFLFIPTGYKSLSTEFFITNLFVWRLCEILRYRWGGCFWFLNMLSVRCIKCQIDRNCRGWNEVGTHVFSNVSKMFVLNLIRLQFSQTCLQFK